MNETFFPWEQLRQWMPLISGLGIALTTIVLAWIINRIFVRYIRKSSEHIQNDPTNYKFLRRAIITLIYLIGFSLAALNAVPSLKEVAQSLLAGAGILALAVGLASQEALSNIVAGVFIVMFKPFRVKDRVIVKDTLSGVVEDITLRHTVIRDFQNRRIVIPNSIISREVVLNADLEDAMICKWVEVTISYDSSVKRAKEILLEEVMNHPKWVDKRSEEEKAEGEVPVTVRVLAFEDSGIRLRAWAWAQNQADAFALGCDVLEQLKVRFDQEGIEIPYPVRTIVMRPPKGSS